MINGLFCEGYSFQGAWKNAMKALMTNKTKECFNLVVKIKIFNLNNYQFKKLEKFYSKKHYLPLKHVIYTIFPYKIYADYGYPKIFDKYSRFYRSVKTSWGTYFYRMINWTTSGNGKGKNQLKEIIEDIKKRKYLNKACYTIYIGSPFFQYSRPLGAPCLHYITLQIDSKTKTLNMFALYRNHDLVKKAYGNYVGLGYLLSFISHETNLKVGILTCLSSHAYIEGINKKDVLILTK